LDACARRSDKALDVLPGGHASSGFSFAGACFSAARTVVPCGSAQPLIVGAGPLAGDISQSAAPCKVRTFMSHNLDTAV